MTLDGKIATRTGQSRWISSPQSRQIVHALRGRVDAIMVGRETAVRDDPLLTARPPGPRTAVRVVLDTHASLGSESQLVRTARETPVLVAVGAASPAGSRGGLRDAGCEVFVCDGETPAARLDALLLELGRRRLTNVLVEGGGRLLGQSDRRSADRRGPRLRRAEALRRRGGRHGHRRRGNRRGLRGAAAGDAGSAARGRRSVPPRPVLWSRARCDTAVLARIVSQVGSAFYIRPRVLRDTRAWPATDTADPRLTVRRLPAEGKATEPSHGPMLAGFLARKSRGPRVV